MSDELPDPAPAVVLQPDSPGTARMAARIPSISWPPLVAGVGAIAAVCGMLDAATFLGLGHVFAETMNGNIVLLAFTVGTRGVPGLTSLLPGNLWPYVVALVASPPGQWPAAGWYAATGRRGGGLALPATPG